jgi:hypothetical protein
MRQPVYRGGETGPAGPAGPTISDWFKATLGWREPAEPFHTNADRECGGCRSIKPGAAFDVPVTPGRPDLNLCRDCA